MGKRTKSSVVEKQMLKNSLKVSKKQTQKIISKYHTLTKCLAREQDLEKQKVSRLTLDLTLTTRN